MLVIDVDNSDEWSLVVVVAACVLLLNRLLIVMKYGSR